MEEVKLNFNEKRNGHFYINDNDEQIAEMQIGISGDDLTVYHTEVSPKAEGRGERIGKGIIKSYGRLCKEKSFESNCALPLCFCSIQKAS